MPCDGMNKDLRRLRRNLRKGQRKLRRLMIKAEDLEAACQTARGLVSGWRIGR